MNALSAIVELGEKYGFGRGREHAFKVRDLALRIFDETRRLGLHEMGGRERFWLEAAALLHDIGVWVGEEHHAWSRRLILEGLKGVLDDPDLEAIAWIAFFHRRRPDPLSYSDPEWIKLLKSKHGDVVVKLAAILRIADALDRSLCQVVDDVKLDRVGGIVRIKVYSRGDASIEVERARVKGELFERVFSVGLEVEEFSSSEP